MDEKAPADAGRIRVVRMSHGEAFLYRQLTTFLGLHRGCRFKACRRAQACSTEQVLCYQALEEQLQPIARSLIARRWRNMADRGERLEVAPVYKASWPLLLAREDEEIALIQSGVYGEDDSLTPCQLWLKNFASVDSRDRAARLAATEGRCGAPDSVTMSPDTLALRHRSPKPARPRRSV